MEGSEVVLEIETDMGWSSVEGFNLLLWYHYPERVITCKKKSDLE